MTKRAFMLACLCALLAAGLSVPGHAQAPAAPPPPTYYPALGKETPPVTFSSARVDFGRVPWGAQPFLLLSVSFQPAVFRPRFLPRLTCSDADVLITLASQTVPPPPTRPLPPRALPPPIVQVWRLTLAARPRLGALRGTFGFADDADPASPEAAALRGTTLPPLDGSVRGAFEAASANLLFGTVVQGQASTRTLRLSAATLAALKGVKVSSASPFLSIKAGTPAADGGGGAQLVLMVTLGPQAPAGSLETEVTATNPQGQALSVPVYANIDPAP